MPKISRAAIPTEVKANEEPQEDSLPLPSGLTHSAGFLLNKSARVIRERMASALAPLDISTAELGVMRIISEHSPINQQVLSRVHNTDRTTTVHLIDRLEEKQLVMRVTNVQDRRSYLLYLTPKGKKTLAKAIKIGLKEQQSFLAPLHEDEWEAMRGYLLKLLVHHTNVSVEP